MRIYISTPINARKEKTFQLKYIAARHRCNALVDMLKTEDTYADDTFVIPHDVTELGNDEPTALGNCIKAVLECDAIYLDHGWETSRGCNLEYRTAKIYGKLIFEHDKM